MRKIFTIIAFLFMVSQVHGADITNKSIGGLIDVLGGATTEILVGGGASPAAPVWTTATGTGAPVRANSPTLITPILGAATGTSLQAIIGNVTPAAGTFTTLTSGAGVIIDYVAVDDVARTNTTLSTDHIVGFIALTATRDYQISSEDIAQAGRVIIVKDEVGKAATFPITVSTEGAETIDGAATISLNSNFAAVYLYSNGSNLFVY